MNGGEPRGGAEEALAAAAGVLAVAAARMQDALPALGRLIADVEGDWLDDAGRAWAERAGLVRRALDRELDAALAAARVVAAAAERLVADGSVTGGPVTGGSAAGGPVTASDAGGPLPARAGAGARLGGTAARRVEEERGMSVARLGEDG
ncbi:hypothetical protein [Pseudonocardia broussonetiae]|uniref:Uncharacterized protein n=1 Tax=Pseudonocardia broussonetiae TaxID=2736640 RepID=A0A6M6JH72_9PSEU|nr:hypothetical protein [Pseudonocardia broussonetiae]QJY46513.1 hypothetical protein HOP40_12400 [Pseudonocardia broussonetiae]